MNTFFTDDLRMLMWAKIFNRNSFFRFFFQLQLSKFKFITRAANIMTKPIALSIICTIHRACKTQIDKQSQQHNNDNSM